MRSKPLDRLALAVALRDQGEWADDLRLVNAILADAPGNGDAHKEKGIAEHKLWIAAGLPADMATGQQSLLRAVAINPNDHDAHASLGGQLKASGRLLYAWVAYRRATQASHGHPYPLVNEVNLEAHLQQKFVVDDRRRAQLEHAEHLRTAQANDSPPTDTPWCFFDLAELRLFAKDRWNALRWLHSGAQSCSARWQAETCRQSLLLLLDVPEIDSSLLSEMVLVLENAEQSLPG